MKKYILTSSKEKIYCVSVSHNVTSRVFATALSDYFYNKKLEFNDKLSKKEAEKILRRSLFFYGIQGQHPDGYFETSFEESEIYEKIFSKAVLWLEINHKYLFE